MLLKGDCIEVMKAMKPNSVDAIVTDPPYGLGFMNKEWDNPNKERELIEREKKRSEQRFKEGKSPTTAPFTQSIRPGLPIKGKKEGRWFQDWCEKWLTEAHRILKPGGSMLVMGGTRTSHRLACAIEDSGFIIKDTLMFLYGSGFPKAQDLGKMIDKRMGKEREIVGKTKWTQPAKSGHHGGLQNSHIKYVEEGRYQPNETIPATDLAKRWDGFKVGGIKPAYEPIIWAVKPPEGSYVDNVLKHGVGAVNVDECRIGLDGMEIHKTPAKSGLGKKGIYGKSTIEELTGKDLVRYTSKGRFPANIILSHHPECVQVGVKRVKGLGGSGRASDKGHGFQTKYVAGDKKGEGFNGGFVDKDGYEQVESWDCHPDCAVRMLNEQSGNRKSGFMSAGTPRKMSSNPNKNTYGEWNPDNVATDTYGDSGGASRFFYCAKASRAERNAGLEGMEKKEAFNYGHKENPGRVAPKKSYPRTNNHPTVKPIKLFEWLIKLITREGQIILDPFIGSGTTFIAAHNTGRKCIGIEKEGEYIEIARRRAAHWRSRPKQLEMTGG